MTFPFPSRAPAVLVLCAALAVAACEVDTTAAPPKTAAPDCTAGADQVVCPGAAWPAWQLVDFQPKSAKFQQTYGLEAFQGKGVLVALFSAS